MRKQIALAAAVTVGMLGVRALAEDYGKDHPDVKAQGQVQVKPDQSRDMGMSHDQMGMGQRTPLQLLQGVQARTDVDREDIASPLAGVCAQLVGDDADFSGMVGYFVDQDRDRITKLTDQDKQSLREQVVKLNEIWKSKYGEGFDIDRDVLGDLNFAAGEIQDPQVVVQNWPVPVTSDQQGAVQAGAAQWNEEIRTQGNIDRGRDIAVAQLTAHNLPPLNISLVDELGGWKIDVPNNRTTDQLGKDLINHLSHLTQDPNQLPADKNEAYKLVTYHVLMAIYGVDAGDSMQKPS